MRPRHRRWRAASTLALLALALTACSNLATEGDKAGGATKVVLRVTSSSLAPSNAQAHFVDSVHARSHGHLRIVVVSEFGGFAPDSEIQAVRAAAAHEVDLAWVGSRTFDSVGVTSLEALSAPLLLDSYALENAVLASPLADQLLAGVQSAGVTGLGMSPGAFQLPIGVKHPLLTPADWKGVAFGTYPSAVQDQTIRALGATPFAAIGDGRTHALDTGEIEGFNVGLPFYASADLPARAPYVTTNVRLWAQIDVLVANTEVLAGLSRQQRAWLLAAAADTQRYAAARVADEAGALRTACFKHAHLINATAAQLAALRSALDPVYVDLEKDPRTSRAITQIRQLAATTSPESPPPIPSTCSVQP